MAEQAQGLPLVDMERTNVVPGQSDKCRTRPDWLIRAMTNISVLRQLFIAAETWPMVKVLQALAKGIRKNFKRGRKAAWLFRDVHSGGK